MGKNLKYFLLAIPLFAIASWEMDFDEDFASASSVAFNPLSLSPVAWWRGDGNALDSARTNNGIWSSQESYATGINGQAMSFIGTNRVEIGLPVDLVTSNDFTLALWFKATSFANFRSIFSAGTLAAENSGYGIYEDTTSIAFQIRLLATATSITQSHSSNTNWSHVVLVSSGTTQTAYFNGATISTITSIKSQPNTRIGIGQRSLSTTGVWGFGFIGYVDDVLFFQKALTTNEVIKLYNWRQ